MLAKLRRPFFVVNPKAYLHGKESYILAVEADRLAKLYDIDILFTAQLIDMDHLSKITSKIILTSQHMDGMKKGKGMGHVLPEALVDHNVKATFLNHAEFPMSQEEVKMAVSRAKELGIITLLCADTVEDAKKYAQYNPTVMLCEPTELIGTGIVSSLEYKQQTNATIKEISNDIMVLQAAGISNAEDVYNAIMTGADGTGATSGIVCSKNPTETLKAMIEILAKAKKDMVK